MRKLLISLIALVGLSTMAALGNYTMTQGSGTTFGSTIVGGVHYVQMFLCDLTTPGQCATVDSSGILTVKGTVTATPTGTQAVSVASAQVASGAYAAGSIAAGAGVDGWDLTQGAKADSACGTATGTCSTVSLLKYLNTAVGSAIPAGTNTIGTTGSLPYPVGATPYTASATGTTAATTATLAGASSVTTYICGFSIRANATAAATGNATVTGVITATLNFTQWTAPLASGLGVTEMIFNPCIPASGQNQSVAVVSAAPGSGGTVSVTAWGYKL